MVLICISLIKTMLTTFARVYCPFVYIPLRTVFSGTLYMFLHWVFCKSPFYSGYKSCMCIAYILSQSVTYTFIFLTGCLKEQFFLILIFIGVQLLYNVVLVSTVQQNESGIHRYISPLCCISFPFRSPQCIK